MKQAPHDIVQAAAGHTDTLVAVKEALAKLKDPAERLALIQAIGQVMREQHPLKSQPVSLVTWVPIEMVTPNDYNPNSVAKVEMRLLYTSIKHDGYTQPTVVIWDPERKLYVIIDGFHRYFTLKTNKDIYDSCMGLLPVVVLNKSLADRMASTVRHNRARGKHSIQGMSHMVFQLLDEGWDEAAICNHLGMSPEELLRLKHITGFSKLFENTEYQKAWVTRRQIVIAKKFREDGGK